MYIMSRGIKNEKCFGDYGGGLVVPKTCFWGVCWAIWDKCMRELHSHLKIYDSKRSAAQTKPLQAARRSRRIGRQLAAFGVLEHARRLSGMKP